METKKIYTAPIAKTYKLGNLMQLTTKSELKEDDIISGMESKQFEQKSFLWEEEEDI